jgi:mediator of RNA polymerase II transcription subunit 12
MQEMLQLLTAPIRQDDLLTADEVYRFSILQDQAIRECPKEVLGLIVLASAEYSYAKAQNDVEGLPLESESVMRSLLELLKRLVLRDATGVARALGVRSPNPHVSGWIDYVTTKLLIPTADFSTRITFDQVLELTNEFTLPFCQVKLALSLSSNDQASQEATDRQQSHVELFANAMDKAISAGNISWVGMLSCLSPEITQHLKVRAQNRILELLPSLRSPPTTDAALAQKTLQMAENLLSVIDAIMRGTPASAGGGSARQPQLTPSVVDHLVDLWELLAAPDNTDPALAAAKTAVLQHWLPLALNFITLHAHAFDPSKPTNDVRARMLVACAGLMQELDALHLPSMDAAGVDVVALGRRVFDLGCLLVDNLAEEARAMCVRAVGGAGGGDGRVRYLFSFSASSGMGASGVVGGEGAGVGVGAEGGLVLSHREKGFLHGGGGGRAGGGGGGGGGAVGAGNTLFSGRLGTPAALWGFDRGQAGERLSVFVYRRWETLSEPTPNVGENDTALSLGLFEARKVQ